MTLLSFDLNSTRARAVGGQPGEFPLTLQLEPPRHDFPMILNWTGRSFDVGSAGLSICRERPFLICRDFLPHLGEQAASGTDCHSVLRRQLGKHQLDGYQALKLVFQQLRQISCSSVGVSFAFPPYLKLHQIQLISQLVEQLRYPLLGSVANPLALALAGHAEHGWEGPAVIMDLDDHALWLGLVEAADGCAYLRQSRVFPRLGLRHWKNRLLNALADCCIASSRRDPRENAAAEQSLYLQLDGIMENGVQGRPSHVAFQASNWYQQLVLQPGMIADFCKPLIRQAIAEVAPLFNSGHALTPPGVVLLSYQAASLPGLVPGLQQFLERWALFNRRDTMTPTVHDPDDFGENLLLEEEEEINGPRLILLSADAAARGAHLVAGLFHHGTLAPGHLDESAPLPEPQPLDSGPARLHFQGRDYFLLDRPFTIGKNHDCDLVFDGGRYPAVAARHCVVMYDLRRFLVKNLTGEGETWVNNQPVEQLASLNPGDWIRLGLGGPRLRFLGQPDFRSLTTIA